MCSAKALSHFSPDRARVSASLTALTTYRERAPVEKACRRDIRPLVALS